MVPAVDSGQGWAETYAMVSDYVMGEEERRSREGQESVHKTQQRGMVIHLYKQSYTICLEALSFSHYIK